MENASIFIAEILLSCVVLRERLSANDRLVIPLERMVEEFPTAGNQLRTVHGTTCIKCISLCFTMYGLLFPEFKMLVRCVSGHGPANELYSAV